MIHEMRCKTCCHPKRQEIELKFRALPGSYRKLAEAYGLSAAGLQRHMARHLEAPKEEPPKGFAPTPPGKVDLSKPAEGPDDYTMQRYREDLARFRDFGPRQQSPAPVAPLWVNGVRWKRLIGRKFYYES